MLTKEKLEMLIDDSYRVAKEHGFHDDYHSARHYLMLVLSEIGEMVEADRKNRHADVVGFEDSFGKPANEMFEKFVKDTFEDEMADVVIRICDFCGSLGITPKMGDVMADMSSEFKEFFGDYTVCEQCFVLSSLVVDIEKVSYDADDTEMRKRFGSLLSFLFEMAGFHHVDLLWHVEKKMDYNEGRPKRHGKAY